MDYKNGKIYKITDIAYTKQYIGSTTQPLCKRFSCHKSKYKKWQTTNLNKITVYDIFDEFGIENCKIELVEEFECENKSQLERKEGEHIKNNDCVNRCIPGRTHKQYRIDHKAEIVERKKQYNIDNKAEIAEYNKQYCINHKAEIAEQKKQYCINHKAEIAEYKSQIIICECGKQFTKGNKVRHNKSKNHINNINHLNQPA